MVAFCIYTKWIRRLKLQFTASHGTQKGIFTMLTKNMNWPQTVTLNDVAVSRVTYKKTYMKKKRKKFSSNLQPVLVENHTGSFNKESAGLFTH
jgi:hypothetical protein